jgi:hypothetical protein
MNNDLPDFKDGLHFEDFCTDLLISEGFTIVRKSGVGPDRGSDILVEQSVHYTARCTKIFRWVVQCKYTKKNDRSIRPADVGDFMSDIPRHKANGYWLMTNARLSTGLEDKLISVSESNDFPFQATYSDGSDLLSFIFKHRSLMRKYCSSEVPSVEVSSERIISPFKQLQSYTEDDSKVFFGRKNELDALMDRIYMYGIVGLFGESGTGKTSLIRAGLVPTLRQEGFLPAVIRCLDNPVTRVRKAILDLIIHSGIDRDQIEGLSATANLGDFIYMLQKIADASGLRIVIILDQFEELFTRCSEIERLALALGIQEANSGSRRSLTFLMSLREDYIGRLWEWSHTQGLLGAWINTYRINRMSATSASLAISNAMEFGGMKIQKELLSELLTDLMTLGDDEVYPPYLQLVCSMLYDETKANGRDLKTKLVTLELYNNLGRAEMIIAESISSSMLDGLTTRNRLLAQQVLDLLTGPEGLRAFLTLPEIARHIQTNESHANSVLEHLTQKKVVHPVVENDQFIGYELVHDFLSRKFFESLSPEAKKMKTIFELFRRAFNEWEKFGVLASSDRLGMFRKSLEELNPSNEEYRFLLKSSLASFNWSNPWINLIPKELAVQYCSDLFEDTNRNIAQKAVAFFGEVDSPQRTSFLKKLICNKEIEDEIRSEAVNAFYGYRGLVDRDIISTLCQVAKDDPNEALRAKAVAALGYSLKAETDEVVISKYLPTLVASLSDGRLNVRSNAVDALTLISPESLKETLLKQLSSEKSVIVRRKIVEGLGRFISDPNVVIELEMIVSNREEDPKSQRNAIQILKRKKYR